MINYAVQYWEYILSFVHPYDHPMNNNLWNQEICRTVLPYTDSCGLSMEHGLFFGNIKIKYTIIARAILASIMCGFLF